MMKQKESFLKSAAALCPARHAIYGMALMALTACNGVSGDIYDDPAPEADNGYGFVVVASGKQPGQIYVDATSYTTWQYIDLHRRTVTTAGVDENPPANWDFAVHRYDAKTNGGSVTETAAADFAAVTSSSGGEFVSDVWTTDRITFDMSQMMQGIVLYAEDYYNPCLSQWLNLDTSHMPPSYTLSGKIYLLRMQDGTYAALRLKNYLNDAAEKGFLTIEYKNL